MKKMFTLLFAVGMFTLAQAQPGTRDNRQTDRRDNQQQPAGQWDQDKGYDNGRDAVDYKDAFDRDDRYGNSRFSNERKRDMMITRINREYDQKIRQVQMNFFMSRFEKQRQIRFLQEQRKREIRMIHEKFNQRNRYDDRNDGRNDGPGRRY